MMDLYPSEQKKIDLICKEEAVRLKNERSLKLNALEEFGKRLMTRLYDAGFIAVVSTDAMDPKNYELVGEDTLVFVPTIDILRRVDGDQEIDFDKMQFESKRDAGYEVSYDGTKKAID